MIRRWQPPPLGDDTKVKLESGWWLSAFLIGAIGGAYLYSSVVHRRSQRSW